MSPTKTTTKTRVRDRRQATTNRKPGNKETGTNSPASVKVSHRRVIVFGSVVGGSTSQQTMQPTELLQQQIKDEQQKGWEKEEQETEVDHTEVKPRRRRRTYRRSLSQNINRDKGRADECRYVDLERCQSSGGSSSHLRSHKSSRNRLIKRSGTEYDVGLSSAAARMFTKMDKKTIATYLSDGKDLSWLTNLVESEPDSDQQHNSTNPASCSSSSDDCVFIDGPPQSHPRWHSERSTTTTTRINKRTTILARNGADRFIVNCATAAIEANFSPDQTTTTTTPTSDRNRQEKSMLDRDEDAMKRSLHRSLYLGQFFRYPRFQFDSSSSNNSTTAAAAANNTKQSTPTSCSDGYDLQSNISRQRLTSNRSARRQQHSSSSSSLMLSIDNLRLMMEKNLIATLISVYILVSLAIIVVLILPYVFNLNAASGGNRPLIGAGDGQPVLENVSGGARMDQVSYQHLSSGADKQTYEIRVVQRTNSDDKGTQTDPDPPLSTPPPPPAAAAAVPATTVSPEPTIELASDSLLKNHERSPTKTNTSAAVKEQNVVVGANSTTKRDTGQSSSLWQTKYTNQRCQPMKIPFCSKSLATILSDTGVPINRLGASAPKNHIAYDKTLLPNRFSQARQSQIEKTLQKYEPIIDIKCYALMPLFLCSIHAPKCVQETAATTSNVQSANDGRRRLAPPAAANSSIATATTTTTSSKQQQQSFNGSTVARLIPPCRSLCREAHRKCRFFFEVLSLKLLDQECDSLPESSDPLVCVGRLENEILQRAASSRICTKDCGDDKFRCTDGECISKKWRCDGYNDCTDKSDEMNCSKCNLSQFYCGSEYCINKAQVCNGIRDCRDGRDERQCLRLAPGPASRSGGGGRQQLQAWNALKDSWVPVCGAHWSAMPMSHQACEVLGYSRANATTILYMPPPPLKIDQVIVQGNVTTANPQVSPQTTTYGRAQTGPGVKTNTKPASGRGRRSPGGWFDVSSSDSFTLSEIEETPAGLASVVAEVAARPLKISSSMGVPAQRVADHMIYYELMAGSSNNHQAAQTKGADTGRQVWDLASMDAAEIKHKSLTFMFYYGPETGCSSQQRPGHLVSSVYLQCENFQCGRPITSYSARIKDQRLAKQASARFTTSDDAELVAPLPDSGQLRLRSFSSQQPNSSTSTAERVQHLEATEELFADDNGVAEESDDGAAKPQEGEKVDLNSREAAAVSSRWVVGGIESMPGEFPYLAALHGGPDEVFFCGGVLISINWLLTAAHCVGNRTQPDGWMVKVGVTRRIASPAFVKKLKVRKIIKHPDFNQESMFNNDIALILLEHSVEYNQYLKPICMPRANTKLGPNNSKECVVVGFGKSKFSQEANYLHVAHFVNVPIVDHTVCSEWYTEHGVNLTEGMLCAGYAEGKRDACQGDSGSGLFCRYPDTNQFFVAGVVSFGIKCATPKLPGVYTSVPSYVNWVEQITRLHGYPLGS